MDKALLPAEWRVLVGKQAWDTVPSQEGNEHYCNKASTLLRGDQAANRRPVLQRKGSKLLYPGGKG